jgi:ABC-type Zn uptake system ZnuABC Zn-binding protein ZnuA
MELSAEVPRLVGMTSTDQSTIRHAGGRRLRRVVALWALAVTTVLAACGGDPAPATGSQPTAENAASATTAPAPGETRYTIVVSDPPLADLVKQVAGDAVEVVSVVPMGADGHTYQPVPSDARTLAEADIYFENGLGLNEVVTAFATANYPSATPHYVLSDAIPSSEVISTDTADQIAAHGHAHNYNAHFWPDPNYAILYVERVAEILSLLDQEDSAGYEQRAAAYVTLLQEADAGFRAALATIPEANRKLVVYHDSWSYYGRRYGIPVIGAIQPTDFSEPSAAEVRDTIDQVRNAGVPAFFGSEVFPSTVLEAIEAESGATYVADLSDDVFPASPGDPEHSYLGMMIENTRIIVSALGGEPSALDTLRLVP